MSISVDVHLLSGKSASLEVEPDASIESLKQRAQRALAKDRGRLLNSSGEVLDAATTIVEAGLQSGDVLTLQVNQAQLKATKRGGKFSAFAMLLGDGSVVSWAMPTVVATALRYRISCEMCVRYRLLVVHLQQSGVMDL